MTENTNSAEEITDQRPWGDAMAVQETIEICKCSKKPSGETLDGRAIRKDDSKPMQ